MPTLIRWTNGLAKAEPDTFITVPDTGEVPPGDVIIGMSRFQNEGDRLIGEGREVGVRIEPHEAVEALAYDLPRISLVALVFPKFRDGRAYSAAMLLRTRLGFEGEVRAVGEVLLEQAPFMLRCGFDTFEMADQSTPEDWTNAGRRYRHVYQRAADARAPAFLQRVGE